MRRYILLIFLLISTTVILCLLFYKIPSEKVRIGDALRREDKIKDYPLQKERLTNITPKKSAIRIGPQLSQASFSSRELPTHTTIKDLILKIKNNDWKVRTEAADELVKIGKECISELIKVLQETTDIALAGKIIHTLGRIGDSQAVDILIGFLNHPNAYLRGNAAEALGKIGDIHAEEKLIAILSDPDIGVRVKTIQALGKLKSSKALQPLMSRLNKEEEMVRFATVNTLAMLKDKRATSKLLEELESQNSLLYKNDIVYALGEISDEKALTTLYDYLDNLLMNEPTEKILIFEWKEAVKITEEAINKIEGCYYE
jgi:HEAT repeat protein